MIIKDYLIVTNPNSDTLLVIPKLMSPGVAKVTYTDIEVKTDKATIIFDQPTEQLLDGLEDSSTLMIGELDTKGHIKTIVEHSILSIS